jgi:hypothetical protein
VAEVELRGLLGDADAAFGPRAVSSADGVRVTHGEGKLASAVVCGGLWRYVALRPKAEFDARAQREQRERGLNLDWRVSQQFAVKRGAGGGALT